MSKQSGAVSLFVVIFATLLITVVTVSFLRLMISDQNRASNNDLSQSAYDSAQSGVEDAKRVLLRYRNICNENGQAACDALATQINAADCNQALRIGDVVSGSDTTTGAGGQVGEVKIQQTSSNGDASLDQAYTCVKISLLTDDYLGSLSAGESKLVPLVAKSSDGSTDFDKVTVEWFSTEDIGKGTSGANTVSLDVLKQPEPLTTNWPSNRPSVLRTQLMQFGGSFTLGGFDATTNSGESNANTLFLYPTSGVSASSESFTSRDSRTKNATGDIPVKQNSETPLSVHCEASISSGGYACKQTFTMPTPIDGGNRTAFLRLTPMYNASHFRVTMTKNGNAVQFNGVQPEIDSTGRANDLFRRVSSRVDIIDTSFAYPDGAVDVGNCGSLCKDFSVTDTVYIAPANTCTP